MHLDNYGFQKIDTKFHTLCGPLAVPLLHGATRALPTKLQSIEAQLGHAEVRWPWFARCLLHCYYGVNISYSGSRNMLFFVGLMCSCANL